ncbi:MAG: hypothetical protein QMD09_04615 [Desulfatibacillaceae bacterium]|nr:hypothetical protein [Desulfatibacillaceae bacterium]
MPFEAAFKAEGANTGDWVDLEIGFSLPKAARLEEPVIIQGLSPLTAGQIKLTRRGLTAKVLVNSLEDWSTDYLTIAFIDPQGQPGILKSQPLALKVASGLPDDPAAVPPRPIRGIEQIRPWHKRLAPLFVALVVAGVALFLIKRLFGAGKNPMALGGEKPHETALKGLNRLSLKLAQGNIEPKAFYFELSLVLRAYLEGLRGFPAVRMTSQEIAAFFSDSTDRRVVELLFAADAVKFAKGAASALAMRDHLDMVGEFVKSTMPKEQEAKDGNKQEKPVVEASHG